MKPQRNRRSPSLTIALAQMAVDVGLPEANLARARALGGQALDAKADLLLLPELWLHGYDLEHAAGWAAPLGEGGFAEMASLARARRLYVAGSLLERHAGGISNTAALYDPQGELAGAYRKLHLFRPMGEHLHLTPGERPVICATRWGPVGLAICYDLRFPELFRALALAGAVAVLACAQWPAERAEAWELLVRARALENQLFVAGCNRVGPEAGTGFAGGSLVADPLGQVVARGGDAQELVLAKVGLQQVEQARRAIPILDDLRPDGYGL